MPRAKRGFKARRRRNRILRHASGFSAGRSRLASVATEAVHKSWQYAYRHRRLRKRDFRRLWIVRIGAAARPDRCATPARLLNPAPSCYTSRAMSQAPVEALDQIEREIDTTFAAARDEGELRHAVARVLGREGSLTLALRRMTEIPPAER